MRISTVGVAPRTTTDIIFDQLRDEIVTLKILPGTKISEAEVARRMGVSRQPVRDAFNRLANMDLLLIRPQRPTVVRPFSLTDIQNARFVRQAVELEVVERACEIWNDAMVATLDQNLQEQKVAIDANQIEKFHDLDFQFHHLICELSGYPLAFEVIENSKRKVDRLCILSLEHTEEVAKVLDDHLKIAEALKARSTEQAREFTRRHLSRLDETIESIHESHSEYFE